MGSWSSAKTQHHASPRSRPRPPLSASHGIGWRWRLRRLGTPIDLVTGKSWPTTCSVPPSSSRPLTPAFFLMFMTALETMIEQGPRPDDVKAWVDDLISQTRQADLDSAQKASLLG